MALDAIPVV